MTTHEIINGNSNQMSSVANESVDLIVTSPPYPMIEMWDEQFAKQNPEIQDNLSANNGEIAFELMHIELDKVWLECNRVLKQGGFACINIGDATRTLNKNFRLYANHARIIQSFNNLGFSNLPNILWRKPTNSPNKFMGSGMLPAGAYVTLEHEFILLFRKGVKKEFKPEEKRKRNESSYFWEERNIWFSDLWDIKGTTQKLNTANQTTNRLRSGAFPLELAYRLINMFSVKNDTILDPFLGTGTSSLAAIASNRNSIGIEMDETLIGLVFESMNAKQIQNINEMIKKRIDNHLNFVQKRQATKGEDCFIHQNIHYHFPVVTKQETNLLFNYLINIERKDNIILAEYFNAPVLDYVNGIPAVSKFVY